MGQLFATQLKPDRQLGKALPFSRHPQKKAMEVMGLACDLITKMKKAEWHWAHSAFI